jgi:2-hydroxychromene-2-carboxylate isomerase
MAAIIDYYMVPNSPWTYLGHERFGQMAQACGAQVRVRPFDLNKVLPLTGGVVFKDRHPARLAYRLVELKRFRDFLGIELNVQPAYFPVDGQMAARLIIAVQQQINDEAAFKLAGALLAAVWTQERNLADHDTLAQVLAECQMPANCLTDAGSPAIGAIYEQYTEQAIKDGVFGAPSYVLNGEVFWGQDRLMLLQKALGAS